MAKLIVDGARMHCTMGTAEAKIGVTSHAFVKVGGALVATEADKEAMGNIPHSALASVVGPTHRAFPSPKVGNKRLKAAVSTARESSLTRLSVLASRADASRFAMWERVPSWK